jgi:7-alpha-hydroxysteroid dehydrogenase
VDRVALVTGADTGIGWAIARRLQADGFALGFHTRDEEDDARDRFDEIAAGGRAEWIVGDVSDPEACERIVGETVEKLRRIDVLVNNAGGSPPRPALQTSEKMFEAAFHFNVTTAFALSRLAIPHMQKAGGGSIVNISSAAGRIPQPNFAAYGTAKAALSFLTRQLAAEFAPAIRVNAIGVGAVKTSALMPYLNEQLQAAMEKLTPMKRLGEVEDIATMALYLASPASSWVTGKVFEVDGGTESTNWPF